MKRNMLILPFLLGFVALFSCGGGDKEQNSQTADYLPEKSIRSDLKRVSDIRTFVGESLWEYINGGAELYHQYNFVEVVTADYKNGGVELVADIYRFDTPLNAFGLYSMLSPADAEIIKLGVEGFLSPASVNFSKGEYLVRLTGFEESSESDLALLNLAEEINELIPGTTERPAQFSAFPDENKIGGSDKYFSGQYMGQSFLADVYTRDFSLDVDTVTLFISPDETGSKFMAWSGFADKIRKKKNAPGKIPFDENHSFIVEDNFYGDIIVGLKKGKLAGMINFREEQPQYLVNWLNTF